LRRSRQSATRALNAASKARDRAAVADLFALSECSSGKLPSAGADASIARNWPPKLSRMSFT
jgi:hypothetical protein